MPNFLIMENINCKNKHKTVNFIRDMSRFDEKKFINDLNAISKNDIFKETEVNKKYDLFHDQLIKVLDDNAPLKKLSIKQSKNKLKPWITKGIRKSISQKQHLYKRFVNAKTNLTKESLYTKYKKYRNKTNQVIRASKKRHFNKYFEDNKCNMKKLWSGINNLLSR